MLEDQLSKALRQGPSNSRGVPSFPPEDDDDLPAATTAVSHNSEHIADWNLREVHEYLALCSGKECSWIVPFAGNAFVAAAASAANDGSSNANMITPAGLVNWTDGQVKVSLFFHCVQPGDYLIALRTRVPDSGSSLIKMFVFTCNNSQQCQPPVIADISLSGTETRSPDHFEIVPCGTFTVAEKGYVKVELRGIEKIGAVFADITHAIVVPSNEANNGSRRKRSAQEEPTSSVLDGTMENRQMRFVTDPDDFYFGRRGPSVHLNYVVPRVTVDGADKARNIEYFYNEVTVPAGQDVVGSYFCASGFTGGYFGIQVNSGSERRILFSIWSAYDSDNPKDIPENFKVELLRKGEDVYVGEFGNEGAGAQSYLKYMWKPDTTYRFLVQALPIDDESNTKYSAWFKDDADGWKLIASFRKPRASTWLKGLYSFSENFIPDMGHVERYCIFGNQWAWDAERKEWVEITQARFTADATATKGNRADVAGGVMKHGDEDRFFLRNCGFFSDSVEPGTSFCRGECSRASPQVDFATLN